MSEDPNSSTLEFAQLSPAQRYTARLAKHIFETVIKLDYLNKSRIHSVCDIGAGRGGPTFAIMEAFYLNPKQVIVLEHDAEKAEAIHKAGILQKKQIYTENAFTFLARTQDQFDLMTACMFGPDDESGVLTQQLFQKAQRCLTPTGHLLIYSDRGTMETVKQACLAHNITFQWIEEEPGYPPLLTTAVISKKALEEASPR